MKEIALICCSLLAVLTAVVAFTRKSLVHGGLMLVVCWMALAGLYFVLGAEFVALAQMLVYVGAVSMVVLFAVVMTRPLAEQAAEPDRASFMRVATGVGCAAPVLGFLLAAQRTLPAPAVKADADAVVTVRDIGLALMERHVAPLLLIGLLLTSALIGAVLLAAPEDKEDAR
ncbi:NADH-quinone oxidoreductase subunit J [Nibricoccus sp. IMCC34717]|uniref:NADH-quinone oxidoreductase subunit J family protein n=1 Tax=Nibricoccus sp. IMCC34717 TaxID=3034021 RepID=UPI00384DB818